MERFNSSAFRILLILTALCFQGRAQNPPATQIGLDRKRFDLEFDSGKYDADIRRDIEDGEMYGIEGTPTIFINGVMLTELGADPLRAAIEKAFAKAGKRP